MNFKLTSTNAFHVGSGAVAPRPSTSFYIYTFAEVLLSDSGFPMGPQNRLHILFHDIANLIYIKIWQKTKHTH